MIYALLFIIGTVFGSFYTVVATRLPENKSIIKPGSHCDKCDHFLKWYELIPIISFIFLRGRCIKCHQKISPVSTIVELLLGLSLMVSYYFYGFNYEFLIVSIILSLSIIIFVSDFKYMIILDSPLVTSALLIIGIQIYYFGFMFALNMIIRGLAVFIVIYIIKFFGDRAFKQESLGGGDVKLGFIMGLVLGIRFGLVAFALGAFIALPYAIILQMIKKENLLAFGPFLSLGILLSFIFTNFITYLFTLL